MTLLLTAVRESEKLPRIIPNQNGESLNNNIVTWVGQNKFHPPQKKSQLEIYNINQVILLSLAVYTMIIYSFTFPPSVRIQIQMVFKLKSTEFIT